eukprot:CAMPEP_0197865656 /NCGR_PEP_ID=MMETSP1438-20131217/43788_1 /TAXON_ID=1461541 /ORGANISM="Pterosperma sp., Strain CCMP1384" /LENGTH=520 /DNA_ID=CAMNT_0043484149 /DNA_START=561 /DNA_END=2123 /DNA_ORIENTATION=+
MATNMVSSTQPLGSRHQQTPGIQQKTKSRACNVVICQTSTSPRSFTILLQGRSEGRAGIVHTQLRSQGRAGVSRQVICSQPGRRSSASSVRCSSTSSDTVYSSADLTNDRPGSSNPPQSISQWILSMPLEKYASWLVTFTLVYLLREFLGIAFMSFVISYVANSTIQFGTKKFPERRRLLTVCFFAVIILLVAGFGLLTVPTITREAADLVSRIQSENPYVLVGDKLKAIMGDSLSGQAEYFLELLTAANSPDAGGSTAVLSMMTTGIEGPEARAARLGSMIQRALSTHASYVAELISQLILGITRFSAQGTVSLIFSFIIVWDLPTLVAGVTSLKHSKLSTWYGYVVPSITKLGTLVGKAIQAQLGIAFVNTMLTALMMTVMHIPGCGFLSMVVFFASFIPVAGAIMSTVPIAFVALSEYGVASCLWVLLGVVGIHMVEAYILNPIIYSQHLKLHPLIVLMVLVLAEHSLGVFGLLVAVPFTVFIVQYITNDSVQPPHQQTSLPTETNGDGEEPKPSSV